MNTKEFEENNKMRDNIFREYIPLPIVNQILQILHFDGVNDKRFFTSKDLNINDFQNAIIILEPYYIPCKAKKYLYTDLSQHRILTIIRQILKPIGYSLFSQERTIDKKKEMFYQIIQIHFDNTIPAPITISFT
jgi:hypothetical protein